MQQHPLRDNMRLLVHTKWRAHKTAVAALKGTGVSEEHVGINGDGVALVQLVLKRTAPIANDAPAHLKDRLWLFRSENRNSPSRILALNEAHIAHAIRKLILRHDIRGDDGRPLRVNVFRFRKTLENRLWRLSGGDPFAVARIANHSVAVADSHYLRVTPEMQRNHKFLGEALVSTWRGESAGTKGAPSAPLPPTTTHTPVGRCKDPYQGDKAPKTGEPCMDFLSCFGCRSYVLVEDARDLHRVLSFCEFLDRERERINAADWAEHYGWIVRVVNEVAQERFNAALVKDARQRAKSDPHFFWKDPTIQAAARAR